MRVFLFAGNLARTPAATPFRAPLLADFGYGQGDYYYGFSVVKYSAGANEFIYRLEINGLDGNWLNDFDVLVYAPAPTKLWENSKPRLFNLIDLLKEHENV